MKDQEPRSTEGFKIMFGVIVIIFLALRCTVDPSPYNQDSFWEDGRR